jgi:hypothetical protein
MANEKEINIKMTYKEDTVIFEGDAESLSFLGNLFISQAGHEGDCGFQIAYDGAGQAFFDKTSNVGLYIHRLPCSKG